MESLNLIISYIYIEIHFLAINLFYFHLQIPPLKQNAFHKRFKNAVVKYFLCLSDTYSNCWALTPTPTDEQPARF